MGDKADWGDTFLRHLIDACKEEIEAGNRPMGIFTTTGWKNVVSKFAEKSGDTRTKKQLKNKLDLLKKEYVTFMEFKNCATGLGWDEAKQTIDCSDEWWDEHLAVRTMFLHNYILPFFLMVRLANFFSNCRDATIVRKESNATILSFENKDPSFSMTCISCLARHM